MDGAGWVRGVRFATIRAMSKPPASQASRVAPERWRVDAGASDVALLDIPASAQQVRVFEIDVRLVVRVPAAGAWHALSVELNGAREWTRRIASAVPGDSLDFHCRRELGVGQALRVRVLTQVGGGAQRQRLTIEAEESP